MNDTADPTHQFLTAGYLSGYHLGVESGRGGESWLRFRFSKPLVALEALCGLMMLLCGVNIALLVLSRVRGRLHEFAMRSALGATRRRLIFQVMTETLLLGIGGLLGGGVFGWQLARLLVNMIREPGSPVVLTLDDSAAVFLFAAAIGLGAALLSGIWPAWRASGNAASVDLRQIGSGRSAGYFGHWIVPMQVALGVVLLNAALLLAGTLENYLHEHSGFSAGRVLMAELDFSNIGMWHADQPAREFGFLHLVQGMPGVQSAALMAVRPISGRFFASEYHTRDAEGNLHVNEQMWPEQVSLDYFRVMGTHILRGRGFAPADISGDPTCILSAGAEAYFFPGQSALGRFLISGNGTEKGGDQERCRIIGIAEDARLAGLLQPAPLAVYLPLEAESRSMSYTNIAVRASSQRMAASAVHEAFARLFPGAPQPGTWLFHDEINFNLSQQRLLSSVSGGFALLALALLVTGLYGILARDVADRRREIGIRMALGAQRPQIVRALVRSAALRIGIGMLAGAVLAFFAGHLLRTLLYEVGAENLGIAAATLALLLAVLTCAFIVPAVRAASIDPREAIHYE